MRQFESGNWYDIETAPKDGTYILLSWPDKKVTMSRFHPHDGFNNSSKWISFGEGGGLRGCSSFSLKQPTHWQPLPQPPEVTP